MRNRMVKRNVHNQFKVLNKQQSFVKTLCFVDPFIQKKKEKTKTIPEELVVFSLMIFRFIMTYQSLKK